MKKIILLIVLLFSLLAISNVSANEIVDNASDDSIMLVNEASENSQLELSDNSNVDDLISLDDDEDDDLDEKYEIEYSNTYNNSYVNLTLPSDAEGNLTVSIMDGWDDDDNPINKRLFENVELIDGKASVKLPCLELKSYGIEAKYTGSDYTVNSIEEAITITPNVIIPKAVWINGDNYVSFELPDGVTLTLYIYKNDDLVTNTTIKNGSKIKLDNLTLGEFIYRFEYENGDYSVYSKDFYLEVRDISPDTKFDIFVPDVLIGEEDVRFAADLPGLYEGTAKIIIDGNESSAIIVDLSTGYLDAYLDISYLNPGVHSVGVIWENDDYFKDSVSNTTFNIGHITINVDKTYTYESVDYIDTIYVECVDNATGYVLCYIDGKLHAVAFASDKYISFYLDNLTTGKHDYEIKYSGDEKYDPYTKKGSFNIDYEIRFESFYDYTYSDSDLVLSDINQIIMYINNHATGNLIVNINGKNYNVAINKDGEAIFNMPVLPEGEYLLTVKYNGNNILSPKTFNTTIKIEYGIIISDDYVNLTLPSNATGNLSVKVYDEFDGELLKTYNVKLVNGKASVSLSDLEYGEYYIDASYTGDDYSISDYSSSINVENPNLINITIPDEISLNQESYITIELPNNLSGKIKIEIGNENMFTVNDFNISLLSLYLDDEKLNITGEGNSFKVKIPTSKIGEHILSFYYDSDILSPYDDEDWGMVLDIMPLKVNCPSIPEVYPIAKNNDVISVEMPNDTNGTLTVRLYDAINYDEDKYIEFTSNNTINGKTNITLTNLTPKLYAMELSYVDEKYGNYTTYQRIDVEYYVPNINIVKSNSTSFAFNLESDASGAIVFAVDNKFYYSKVINGSADIVTSKLSSANPEMSIYYSGDEKYAYTIKKIPATKEKVTISSPNISTQYNTGKYLTATLKDSKGKVLTNAQVTIVLNGVSKTIKTNSKGQVKLLVNLAPKTYTATVTFTGNNTHDKSTVNVKVVVTKATPKLTATKKTYKAKVKTKKYSIALKDNKGSAIKKAKVTIKIKGKTYTATTNAKGQATFKITKLTKKGTYKSTVKFAGNSYYNSISKSVKIVVKK